MKREARLNRASHVKYIFILQYTADISSELSLKPVGLSFHVLYNYVVDVPQRGTVLKHFPWRVRVEMDLYKFFVADCEQAVAINVSRDIRVYFVFREAIALYQQLGIEFVFNHNYPSILLIFTG